MTSSTRQLLVTGATGFLGSSIVRMALNAGWRVCALDRSPGTQAEGVQQFVGDIGDIGLLRRACKGVSAVVHAAGLAHVFGPDANDYSRFKAINEDGTFNVVDAALDSGVSRIALVSSVSVYGSHPGVNCDETVPCNPHGPYAISKWHGELRATERMAESKGSLTILRFATIYGKGDRGNVAKLIDALDRGRFIWPGPGNNRKSLIYKEDAARACLRALEHFASGTEIFNVSAPPATMTEIVAAICEALQRPVPRLRVPLYLLKAAGRLCRRMGDPGHLDQRLQKFTHDDVFDGAKFETSLDFRPAISLSDGIRSEVEYLRPQARR